MLSYFVIAKYYCGAKENTYSQTVRRSAAQVSLNYWEGKKNNLERWMAPGSLWNKGFPNILWQNIMKYNEKLNILLPFLKERLSKFIAGFYRCHTIAARRQVEKAVEISENKWKILSQKINEWLFLYE
jgi:hypothetical protein